MDEQRLDELLDAWRVEPASHALYVRVLASAPKERGPMLRLASLGSISSVRLWLAGAGFAAAVAGVSCGVLISTVAVREAQDEALVTAAVSGSSSGIKAFSEPAQAL